MQSPVQGNIEGTPDAAPAPTAGWTLRPRIGAAAWSLLALLLVLVAILTAGLVWNEDLWWYLASGEVVLDQGGLPDHDLFLYTSSEDTGWPAHSWLWGVLLAVVHRYLGLIGVVLTGAAVAMAVTALVFWRARVDRFGLANGLLAALVIAAAAERLSLKSELASWLLLVVFFYFLDRDAPFTWRTLAGLAALLWLWAHLHAGYPLGIAIALAYSVGGFLEGWWTRRRHGVSTARPPPLWTAPVLFLASLATPRMSQRLGMLEATSDVTTSAFSGERLKVSINELQKPFEVDDPTYATFYLLALAVGGVSLLASRSRTRRLARLFFLAGMAVIAYSAIRHVTGLVIAAALVSLSALGEHVDTTPRASRRRPVYLAATALFALLLVSAIAGLWLLRSDFEAGQSAAAPYTLSPISTCPGAADYIHDHGLQGPIFNDMILGGYLVYRLYPEHRLFADNRILAARRQREYMTMSLSRERWLEGEERYGFRVAVLSNLGVPSRVSLRAFLAEDPRWRLAYFDPLAAVFVRESVAPPSELRFGRRDPPPGEPPLGVPFASPESGPGSWARQAAGVFFRTDAAAFLDEYLTVLGRLRRYPEIEQLATEALAARPTDAALYRNRGSARMRLQRSRDGLGDIRQAVRYEPDNPRNHFIHALALRESGELAEALAAVDRALRLEPRNGRYQSLRRQLAAQLGT